MLQVFRRAEDVDFVDDVEANVGPRLDKAVVDRRDVEFAVHAFARRDHLFRISYEVSPPREVIEARRSPLGDPVLLRGLKGATPLVCTHEAPTVATRFEDAESAVNFRIADQFAEHARTLICV